jgi:hypothetical protein
MTRLPRPIGLILFLLSMILFHGCAKKENNLQKITYTFTQPVFASRSEVLANIRSSEPRLLENPGKIYIKGKYLLINEINKGVHIIDNSNPRNPVNTAFINIPGNLDIAMHGSYLYADLSSDLVAININDPLNAKLESVKRDMFTDKGYSLDSTLILIAYITKDTTIYTEPGIWYANDVGNMPNASSSEKTGGVNGKAGSTSRFAISHNYLYTVSQSTLNALTLTSPGKPELTSSTPVGWQIESIFPFGEHLFIGSASGMFIYDVSLASAPAAKGSFGHATACDPVVTDGKYAYSTLRTGTTCTRGVNQLDVLDVEDVNNPKLLKTYPMNNPHGVGIDNDLLFICEAEKGLKIYDASEPNNLKLLRQEKSVEAIDVIPYNNILIVTSPEGIYQYDYSDVKHFKLLSKIKVPRKISK